MSYHPIYVRKDYADLAKVVHSVSGTVTTLFLFTRLWVRGTSRKGLWLDDYILTAAWALQVIGNGLLGVSPSYGFNVLTGTTHGTLLQYIGACSLYVAICLSKNAFATTLLRLASGWAQALLYLVVILNSAFTIAVVIVSWIPACSVPFQIISIPGVCLSPTTVMWTQTGYCFCMIVSDIILACMPWQIIQGVKYIPAQEKWNVAVAMSLVGLAGLVEIARVAFSMLMPYQLLGELDFTYGIVATYCLIQAECAVFVIAQSIPVIRVMLQSDGSSPAGRPVSSAVDPDRNKGSKGKQPIDPAPQPATFEGHEGLDLVQLATGKIVRADSDEGRAQRASEEEAAAAAAGQKEEDEEGKKGKRLRQETGEPAERGTRQSDLLEPEGSSLRQSTRSARFSAVDDEVHRVWMELGLSKRAWSQSPDPPPAGTRSSWLVT